MGADTRYPPSRGSPTPFTPSAPPTPAQYVSLVQLQQALEEHARHHFPHHNSRSTLPVSINDRNVPTYSTPEVDVYNAAENDQLNELVANGPGSTIIGSERSTPNNGGVSLLGTPELNSFSYDDFDTMDDMDHTPQANNGGSGLEVAPMPDNASTQLAYRLSIVEAQLAEKAMQLEERMNEYQELKMEYKELKQECRDIKQENKDIKRECKDAKQEDKVSKEEAMKQYQQSRQEYTELMGEFRELNVQFRRSNEDRRLLQARNLVLQNEVLLLQGDVRFMLRSPGEQPPSRGDQLEEQTPAHSTPNKTAGQSVNEPTSAGKKSTPQAQPTFPSGVEVTPTPSRAALAKANRSFPPPDMDDLNTSLVPFSDTAAMSPVIVSTPRSVASKASNTFNPGFGIHGPLNTRKSSPALRERASFHQSGRFDDPFQQSPVASKQSSMASLATSSRPSSSENLRGTPAKAGPHQQRPPSSKALTSTNWRQPPPQRQLASGQSPESAPDLPTVRNMYAVMLAKIETWADVYCGTIHTSVRSKEQRTADMIKTLGALVGSFDLERVFNKLEFRTLLVTAHVNRAIFERLFGEAVINERFGDETVARLRELNDLEAGTSARDPAKQREVATEKAEILGAAFAAPGAWRVAEAKAMTAEVCGVLNPIIPISERSSGVQQMEALVEEALQVVGAVRGMPARAWHMAFDVAGARVNLATMAVRGSVECRQSGGSAMPMEEEHAVVLGVTPHLVSKLWTPGGVAPEELLKAEVLTHPVARGFFAQHR
ncbi:transforming acidic coiled-coil-containing protein [Diplodia corticola]|uniref:Transforming acidic coiled-coil-containing protein n=1 Tax=Diplodia corticola TaxID=236234 RepID=A0A1J9RPY8_9PEZI|nr:transforming acidic coiled-coil-containing protein [Diplodia corticola]OJD34627.1 transforming acidic coiled-coil-containing protein [Diplodia corticola]